MKEIAFTKMHGIGNDYVYINCMDGEVDEPEYLAKIMSPRRFSVGSDGVILICPSRVADARMRMFNADGSEGKMCGNGTRCIGKYLYDRGVVKKEVITLETLSGIKTLKLNIKDGAVSTVAVDMGRAITAPADVPVVFDGEKMINEPVSVAGREYRITAVSMGNPHAVTYVDDVKCLDLEAIGPDFENHAIFPENTVGQCGLTDVRTPDNGQLDRQIQRVKVVFRLFNRRCAVLLGFKLRPVGGFFVNFFYFARIDFLHPRHQRMLKQAGYATTVRCGNRMDLTEAQGVEIGDGLIRIQTIGFVSDQKRRFLAGTQVLGDGFVSRHQARARIYHEQHDIRFFDSQQRLLGHTGFHAVFCTVDTTGINTDKLAAFYFSTTVLTVTSQPREIRHQRISGAC